MLNIPEEVQEEIRKMEEEQDKDAAVLVSVWALGQYMPRAERMHALAEEAKELHKDRDELERLIELAKVILTDGAASKTEEHHARPESAIPVPKPVGGGPASSKPNFEAN